MNERPVNPAQASAFFLQTIASQTAAQNVQLSLSLGELWPPERLQSAWQHMVATHGILRSAFRKGSTGEYFRREHEVAAVPWISLDWKDVAPADIPTRWQALMAEDAKKSFDLSTPPLLRITSIILPGGHCHSLVSFPRMLLDEDGLFQILCDWLDALEGHGRTAADAEEAADGTAGLAKSDWWAQLLAGTPTPTRIEIASAIPGRIDAGKAALQKVLGRDISKAIKSKVQGMGITSRDFFLGAWSFLLSRLSSQERVLFLAHAHLPSSIPTDGGAADNVLPFLAEPTGSQTINEYLKKIARAEKERTENAGIPLDRALALAQPARQAVDFHTTFHWAPPSLNSRIHDAYPRWINLDARIYRQPITSLSLEVRADNPIELKLDYDAAALPPAQAEQIMMRLELAVDEFLLDGNTKLSDACILTDAEWASFRLAPPSSELPPSGVSFLEKIEVTIGAQPKAIAVQGPGDATVTYDELDSLADALASYLRKENLAEGWNIAICLTPTSWLPVATLATLRAGDTCLPLDPRAGAEWLNKAVEACDAELLICDSLSAPSFEGTTKKILIIDQQWESIGESDAIPPRMAPAKIAFLLATSDAEKKIICQPLTPTTLSTSCEALTQLLDLQAGDRVALLQNPGTAGFVETVVSTLGSGATLLVEDEAVCTLGSIAEVSTHLRLTSRQWRAWVTESVAEGRTLPQSLRTVNVEGAPFPPSLYSHWQQLSRGQVLWTSFLSPSGFSGQAIRFTSPDRPGSMPELHSIPIGTPTWGVKSRLNDHAGQPLAPHHPGTLEVSLKKDSAWKSETPAWRDAQGWIHFVPSRLDLVERALCDVEDVLDAHAVLDEDAGLLAWIVRRDRSDKLPSEFFEQMAARLPASLRPDSLFAVREFPLTADGHIEVSKLPHPAPPAPPAPPVSARSAPEKPTSIPRVVKEWEPLVSLSATPDTPTLFLVHDLEGDPAAYKTLSGLLAEEWSVYGTSARGLNDPRACHGSVDSEAAALIEAICALDPEGPYHLCGHGYGAVLAFEMARQLRLTGREVPFLMLAGGPAPELEVKKDWKQSLVGLFGGKSAKPSPRAGTSTPVSEAHLKALKEYKTQPLDGPAGLILAVDQGREVEMAWQACVPDFFLERMSCAAADMLTEPAVKRLAVILKDCSLPSDEEEDS
ncbi:hypothetical protein BH09VER1_BH09VER1_16430 [soil metagenome]